LGPPKSHVKKNKKGFYPSEAFKKWHLGKMPV